MTNLEMTLLHAVTAQTVFYNDDSHLVINKSIHFVDI